MFESLLTQIPAWGWNAFWVSQFFIVLAFFSDLVTWQLKKREHVLFFLAISSAFVGIHFLFLQEWAGTLFAFIYTIRSITCIFSIDKKWFWIFLGLVLITGFFSFHQWYDGLALVAACVFTYAAFCPNDRSLRLWYMCGTVIWIIFQIFVFTPAGILLDSFFLVSNVVGYYRFYKR